MSVESALLSVSLVDESVILSLPGPDSAESASEWGNELRRDVHSLLTDFIQHTQAHTTLDAECARKAHDLKTALRILGCSRAAFITEIIENTAIANTHTTSTTTHTTPTAATVDPQVEESLLGAAAAADAAVLGYLVCQLHEVYSSTLPTLDIYPWLKLRQ